MKERKKYLQKILYLSHGGPVVVGQVGLDGHPVGVMLVPRLHRVLGHHHGEAV